MTETPTLAVTGVAFTFTVKECLLGRLLISQSIPFGPSWCFSFVSNAGVRTGWSSMDGLVVAGFDGAGNCAFVAETTGPEAGVETEVDGVPEDVGCEQPASRSNASNRNAKRMVASLEES